MTLKGCKTFDWFKGKVGKHPLTEVTLFSHFLATGAFDPKLSDNYHWVDPR